LRQFQQIDPARFFMEKSSTLSKKNQNMDAPAATPIFVY
jgi:hypothetical protein